MTNSPRVNTKKAEKRDLRFEDVVALRTELDSIEQANESGTLRTTGNWSAGRIFAHLAEWITYYYDGFPFKIPLPLRMLGPMFKKRFVEKGFGAGMPTRRPPNTSDEQMDCGFEEGLAKLRAALARIENGESLAHKNPFLGQLTHDEGVKIHLHHAEHHLGFIHTS